MMKENDCGLVHLDGNGDGSLSRMIEEASIQSCCLLWHWKRHNLKTQFFG